MATTWLIRLGAAAFLLCLANTARARSFRVDQIPNGAVNGCLNCHLTPGGPRNPFGLTIESGFLDAAGNVQWGPTLAAIDSDGDGRSNGQELLDPTGSWVGPPNPGSPNLVRNPGVVDAPPPVPALPPQAIVLFACGLMLAGASRLRRNVADRQARRQLG